jgi:hypothetical protein
VAFTKTSSGACLNLTNYDFNDTLTSLKIYTTGLSGATVYLYQHIDCGGSSAWCGAGGNGATAVNNVGSTFNDQVTSIKVVY